MARVIILLLTAFLKAKRTKSSPKKIKISDEEPNPIKNLETSRGSSNRASSCSSSSDSPTSHSQLFIDSSQSSFSSASFPQNDILDVSAQHENSENRSFDYIGGEKIHKIAPKNADEGQLAPDEKLMFDYLKGLIKAFKTMKLFYFAFLSDMNAERLPFSFRAEHHRLFALLRQVKENPRVALRYGLAKNLLASINAQCIKNDGSVFREGNEAKKMTLERFMKGFENLFLRDFSPENAYSGQSHHGLIKVITANIDQMIRASINLEYSFTLQEIPESQADAFNSIDSIYHPRFLIIVVKNIGSSSDRSFRSKIKQILRSSVTAGIKLPKHSILKSYTLTTIVLQESKSEEEFTIISKGGRFAYKESLDGKKVFSFDDVSELFVTLAKNGITESLFIYELSYPKPLPRDIQTSSSNSLCQNSQDLRQIRQLPEVVTISDDESDPAFSTASKKQKIK